VLDSARLDDDLAALFELVAIELTPTITAIAAATDPAATSTRH